MFLSFHSRVNSFAIEFLKKHNIKVITLPVHCSHELQPFDVGCAVCLKSQISKAKLLNGEPKIMRNFVFLCFKIAKVQYGIISAIFDARYEIPQVLPVSIMLNYWEKTDIFLYNLLKGFTNPLTIVNMKMCFYTKEVNHQQLIDKIEIMSVFVQLFIYYTFYEKVQKNFL